MWQFKKVRGSSHEVYALAEPWLLRVLMYYNTVGARLLFVIIIVLDVHNSLTGSLESSAAPGADSFVYCLLTVSKNFQTSA